MEETRRRILNVALQVLGENPDAGMGEIASAAGVVRRTVYGYFPTRSDLVLTLARQAVEEITAELEQVTFSPERPDALWARFVSRLWPVAHRYRVLLALRRGEYGDEIHALLGSVDEGLAALVQKGQHDSVFGRHLPATVLSQLAYAAVFTIADTGRAGDSLSLRAATITSLLTLGVPEARAEALADAQE